MKRFIAILTLLFSFWATGAWAAVVTFEDNPLPSESYWNGSDAAGGFTSGDAYFLNGFTDWGGGVTSWDGWAYSNTTDITTSGFTNQYSAVTGIGAEGSANYGICYDAGLYGTASPPTVSLGATTGEDYNTTISGAWFTNTTYAYLSMRDGDWAVDPFTEGDFQTLTITGITETGYTAQTVDVILADFTNGKEYFLTEWSWVDLSSLGNVIGLEFSFSGSQVDGVPAYAAMDNLNGSAPVPVPGAIFLFGSGMLFLAGLKRQYHQKGGTK